MQCRIRRPAFRVAIGLANVHAGNGDARLEESLEHPFLRPSRQPTQGRRIPHPRHRALSGFGVGQNQKRRAPFNGKDFARERQLLFGLSRLNPKHNHAEPQKDSEPLAKVIHD